MKKSLIAMLLAACATFAQAENNTIQFVDDFRETVQLVGEPQYTFYAADTSNTIHRRLPNNHVFSRNKLSDRFCWSLSNLPANKRLYNVDLSLIAPSLTTFLDADGNRISSTQHVSNVQMEAKEGRIGECGMFEAGDPAGTYVFQVTVEGKTYPAQEILLR